MSDQAQLYVRQSEQAQLSPKQADQPSLHLLSTYSIPVFWLALFTPKDIILSRVSPDEDYEWPHLVSLLPASLERLLERRAGLISTFGDFIAPWLEQFHAALQVSAGRYVHLDTSQVGALAFSGSAEGAQAWRPQLELMLDGYGESLPVPRAGLMAMLRGEGLTDRWRALYHYGPGKLYENERRHSVFSYCGSGADQPAPWEDAP
jgi:hypothetical protein